MAKAAKKAAKRAGLVDSDYDSLVDLCESDGSMYEDAEYNPRMRAGNTALTARAVAMDDRGGRYHRERSGHMNTNSLYRIQDHRFEPHLGDRYANRRGQSGQSRSRSDSRGSSPLHLLKRRKRQNEARLKKQLVETPVKKTKPKRKLPATPMSNSSVVSVSDSGETSFDNDDGDETNLEEDESSLTIPNYTKNTRVFIHKGSDVRSEIVDSMAKAVVVDQECAMDSRLVKIAQDYATTQPELAWILVKDITVVGSWATGTIPPDSIFRQSTQNPSKACPMPKEEDRYDLSLLI
jgi:hypothetical protein